MQLLVSLLFPSRIYKRSKLSLYNCLEDWLSTLYFSRTWVRRTHFFKARRLILLLNQTWIRNWPLQWENKQMTKLPASQKMEEKETKNRFALRPCAEQISAACYKNLQARTAALHPLLCWRRKFQEDTVFCTWQMKTGSSHHSDWTGGKDGSCFLALTFHLLISYKIWSASFNFSNVFYPGKVIFVPPDSDQCLETGVGSLWQSRRKEGKMINITCTLVVKNVDL